MTAREAWEDVSFQVFTDEDGVLRSGYYPTGEGIVTGNIAIAREWGNMPMQPNDDRGGIVLGSKGIHAVNGVEWDSYPDISEKENLANYMITAAKYLGGDVYEYTAQNDLKAGDVVTITGIEGYNIVEATVVKANINSFRILAELATDPVTGAYGRADVVAEGNGRTLDGGLSYYVPSYTFCWSNPKTKDGNVWDYIEYLRTVGVDPELLVEATFTGGANKYDWGTIGDTNTRAGGIIFWEYIPADLITYIDWATGTVYTGKDFDQTITALFSNPGSEVGIADSWENHSVVAFTNDPNKNNTADWWY